MPKYLPPVKAIKKFCYECSGNSVKERRLCGETDCPLYPYRLGKNPNRRGIGGIGGRRSLKNQKLARKT